MRKNTKKILLIELIIALVSLIEFFVIKEYNYFLYLFLLLGIFILGIFTLKFNMRKERITNDVLLVISISVLSYWLIIYLVGYFSGFAYNAYSKSFIGITKNILSDLILIIVIELLRNLVLKTNNTSKITILFAVISFSMMEIVPKLSLAQITNNTIFIKSLFNIIVPIISKNILLTYLTIKTGYKTSILYKVMMELPLYVVPIIPNFGFYIEDLIITIFPLLILIIFCKLYTKDSKKISNSRNIRNQKIIDILVQIFIGIFLFITILLVSGIGRYIIFTIGSGSMEKTIMIGDVVLIDQKDLDIDKGDIIAYKHDDVVLVHRVIEKTTDSYGIYYRTKGDNNKEPDNWLIKEEEIIGTCKLRIKYIGWPTIKLNQWLTGGK